MKMVNLSAMTVAVVQLSGVGGGKLFSLPTGKVCIEAELTRRNQPNQPPRLCGLPRRVYHFQSHSPHPQYF